MGSVKATTSLLNPMSGKNTVKEPEGVEIPLASVEDSDNEDDDNSDMSNVALSDSESEKKEAPKLGFIGQFKAKTGIGGNAEEPNDTPKETIFHKIKSTTGSAGAVILSTTESAGAAIIGGVKATTHMLNPLGGTSEHVKDDKQIEEEFSKIEIEDEPEPEPKPEVVEKPKVGLFGQFKASVGLANDSNVSSEPATSPSTGSLFQSVKAKTTFTPKDDGIAHNSAPKEGFMDHLKGATHMVNPFSGSSDANKPPAAPASHDSKQPNRFTHHRESSRSSVTASSKSSSGGGIFDSLTGKSSAPAPRPRSEPPKESFIDSLLGKPAPPPKEPSMFEKMTGTGSSNTSSKSDGFW